MFLTQSDTALLISQQCQIIEAILLDKNTKYGNSALGPQRIFSKADAIEQILVRIDDKLSRIKNQDVDDEDAVLDLIGYLVLLRIARQVASPHIYG